MLAVIEEIVCVGVANESMSPLEFKKEVEIGFKKMYDAQSVDIWCARVFFDHDVGGVAPSWNRDAAGYGDI